VKRGIRKTSVEEKLKKKGASARKKKEL